MPHFCLGSAKQPIKVWLIVLKVLIFCFCLVCLSHCIFCFYNFQDHHRIQLACSSHLELAMVWLISQPTIQCRPKLLHPQALVCTRPGLTSLSPLSAPTSQVHHPLLTQLLQVSHCCPGLQWEVQHPILLLSLPAPAQGHPLHRQHLLLLLCLLVATTQTHSSSRPWLQAGRATQHPHKWGYPLPWAHLPAALWLITWTQPQTQQCRRRRRYRRGLTALLHHHHLQRHLMALHHHCHQHLTALYHHHPQQLTAPHRQPMCPIMSPSHQVQGCPPLLHRDSFIQVETPRHHTRLKLPLHKSFYFSKNKMEGGFYLNRWN